MSAVPELRTPGGLTAEQALVGCLLLDPQAWDDVLAESLRDAHFQDAYCQVVFRHAFALKQQGRACDLVSVHLDMVEQQSPDANLPQLQNLVHNVYSTAEARDYAKRVIRDAELRVIGVAAREVCDIVAAPAGASARDVLDRAINRMASVQLAENDADFARLDEVAAEELERINSIADGNVEVAWQTGIEPLDDLLTGGLRPGQLIILAARPSVGKSSFALQIALTLGGGGLKVGMLSMEMSRRDYALRAVANVGFVDYGALRRGDVEAIDWTGFVDAIERLSGNPPYIDDKPGLTKEQIRRRLFRMSRMGIKLVIVDHLLLCTLAGRDRATEIGEITKMLKNSAKEFGMAVLALTQLNRDVEKRLSPRPIMADLRSSGEVEQDADIIVFLWHDRPKERDFGDIFQIGLSVDKNRDGRTGACALAHNGRVQRWSVSTEPLMDYENKDHARGRRA